MFDYYGYFVLVLLFLAVLEAGIHHKKNREMIETLCIKESPWKTFTDNVIVNFLVLTPVLLGYYVIALITEVF